MVYVSNGQVCQNRPWSLQRLVDVFWGIIAFVIYFFKTLVGLDTNSGGSQSGRGGKGGPDGPGGGPKRIGRITNVDDCSMPGGG